MLKKKILCFDLDNVICKTYNNDYENSKPYHHVKKLINNLYNSKKYKIKIYTARGMGTYNGNVKKVNKKFYLFTKKQLKNWKLKYHELILGKISYDVFVDDKSFGFKKKWYVSFEKKYLKSN